MTYLLQGKAFAMVYMQSGRRLSCAYPLPSSTSPSVSLAAFNVAARLPDIQAFRRQDT